MTRTFSSSITGIVLAILITSCTKEENVDNRALLGSGFGIGKATLIVQNLDSARKYYADVLGFGMPASDKFKDGYYAGTRSAAAEFADGSSFELLGIKDTSLVSNEYAFIATYLKLHEGLRLYSFSTSSADTTRQWLSSRGFSMDSLRSGRSSASPEKGWSWDDGGPEWWVAEFDSKNPPVHLPSFVEVVQFPYREIESQWESAQAAWFRSSYIHANGVVGLTTIRVVVDDLDAAREEFIKMGLKEYPSDNSENETRFGIKRNQELHLVAPKSSDDELSGILKSRGAGVFALLFEVKSIPETREFISKKLPQQAMIMDTTQQHITVIQQYAHGVQLEFVQESKQQAALAHIYNLNKDVKLDSVSLKHASQMYTKYCALCHGNDREGNAADFAPSLRSHSLMATTQSSNYLKHAVAYGRQGTAMAAYAKTQGGPLDEADIELLLRWLYQLSGVEKPVELPVETISGDVVLGKTLYEKNCASCHGVKGEGKTAPALGNPMLLATASDAFLRYAISEGRDSTAMRSFSKDFSNAQMDALTAYLRSRASGWNAPEAVAVTEPLPEDYILNKQKTGPEFSLRADLYVSANQLLKALKDSSRMVILDARSKAAWHQSHIPGAVSVPYYDEPDNFIKYIPNDSTWVIAYCACPHAASQRVVNTLRRFGYKNLAILDEGVLVWAQRGYPVQIGLDRKAAEINVAKR
ncbi:c-type cytochrome [Chryseolinea sp. T2]|uniref:c-type cytochrome n=1 Tax=Chryseolinea sp. T2 TaxID=3129255 RepID=UPI003077EE2C